MNQLTPVGFFRETTDDPEEQETFPSILEWVSEQPQANEEQIAAYLENAVCYAARASYGRDVLDPDSSVPLLGHLYTDGRYYWPLELAYYVRRYHLRLPEDFLEHMASVSWQPPKEGDIDARLLDF